MNVSLALFPWVLLIKIGETLNDIDVLIQSRANFDVKYPRYITILIVDGYIFVPSSSIEVRDG